MTTKYKQPGKTKEITAASAISAGDVVAVENTVGIALVDIASGEKGNIGVEGVFEVPKATGTAWDDGELLDFNVTDDEFLPTATPGSGKTHIREVATAWGDAASGAALAEVKLYGRGVSETTA